MTRDMAPAAPQHPRPRRARCPEYGALLVVREGRLDWHDAAGALGRWGLYCSGSAEPAPRDMYERDVAPEGGR